jgi:sporulation protein YlmC with PRC-barrel domain
MTHTSIYALGVALALAASPAFAQSSSSPPAQRNQPSATQSSPSGSPSGTTRSTLPADISSMKAGDLVGKAVHDDKGERIGEVDDVVMNKSTKAAAAVIGVGGFLGIGERKAAVPLNQLKVQGDKIVGTGLTKDSVKSMAEYKDSDQDQWDKMDRNRMLSEASSGTTGSSPAGATGSTPIRPGGSTPSTPGATNPSSGSSGSSSMPSGTSGTSGSTSTSGTATGSPSTSPSAPSGATSPSGSSGSSMGGSSGSANPGAGANPPANATPTEKK